MRAHGDALLHLHARDAVPFQVSPWIATGSAHTVRPDVLCSTSLVQLFTSTQHETSVAAFALLNADADVGET